MSSAGAKPLSIEVGIRAGIAVAVPLLILWALGRLDLTAYATFGAFTALYGRNEPYRIRIRSVSVAGVALLVCIAAGVGVAALGVPLPLLVAALLLVVAGGTLLASTFQLMPAQPLFFVFAILVCAAVPTPAAEIPLRLAIALAAAAFSWVLTMSGWILRRVVPTPRRGLLKHLRRRPAIDRSAIRDRRVWLSVGQNVVGVLIAGAIALAFGLGHAYWAVVSVVAVIPPARAAHSIARSLHRIVGTVIGVALTAALLFWSPPSGFVIAVVVICQVVAEILVGRHYGAALVFITPLALSVSYLSHPAPIGGLAVDRVLETALGAGVGLILVLAARVVERRRLIPDAIH